MTTNRYVVEHIRKGGRLAYQSFFTDTEAFEFYADCVKHLRSRRGRACRRPSRCAWPAR
jgi:hypothetical protein